MSESDTAVLQREWNKKPFSDRISTLLTKSKLKSMQNLNVLGKSTAWGSLSFFWKEKKRQPPQTWCNYCSSFCLKIDLWWTSHENLNCILHCKELHQVFLNEWQMHYLDPLRWFKLNINQISLLPPSTLNINLKYFLSSAVVLCSMPDNAPLFIMLHRSHLSLWHSQPGFRAITDVL